MFTVSRLRINAALVAVACALLIPTGAAFAAGDPPAQEAYYSSYATPDDARSLAREAYYSSYDLPQSPAPSKDPWLPIALATTGVLIIAGVGATQVRRLRFRRAARASV